MNSTRALSLALLLLGVFGCTTNSRTGDTCRDPLFGTAACGDKPLHIQE